MTVEEFIINQEPAISENPLVINQERFKKINDEQILELQARKNDYIYQIAAYKQAIIDAEQNIIITDEAILKLEVSNLGIDQTIVILETE